MSGGGHLLPKFMPIYLVFKVFQEALRAKKENANVYWNVVPISFWSRSGCWPCLGFLILSHVQACISFCSVSDEKCWRQIWRVAGRESGSPSFWEVPGLPLKFHELPRKFFGDFPGSSLTVELNSNPEVPRTSPEVSPLLWEAWHPLLTHKNFLWKCCEVAGLLEAPKPRKNQSRRKVGQK